MATLLQISNTIDSAKVYCIQKMAANLALLKNGQCAPVKDLTAIKRLVRCLTFQINAGVDDDDTNTLYNCLLKALAGFNSNYTIDPSVVIPGQTINIVGTGTIFNSGIIEFNDAFPVQILNYNSTLKQLYGNNPFVNIFMTGFTEDEQAPPTFNYQDNDPTKDLLSITWDYPDIQTYTGYIQIGGSIPGNATNGGSNGSLLFTYSQADLRQDDDAVWYLPISMPLGRRPYYTEVNQDQLTTQYFRATNRLYGFQNNDTAVINVNVI